jgi:hypothetical protein
VIESVSIERFAVKRLFVKARGALVRARRGICSCLLRVSVDPFDEVTRCST